MIEGFGAFVDEQEWNKRFEIPLKSYLDGHVDPCIKLFMGLEPQGLPVEVFEDTDSSELSTE